MTSMNSAYKQLVFIVIGLLVAVALVIALGLYDVVKIEWLGFMEVQPSYRPMEGPAPEATGFARSMEGPQPVATGSIPIEGPAFIGGTGDPINPIAADKISVERGRLLYSVTCIQCHGAEARGDGNVGFALINKPANLTSDIISGKSDGSIFLTITNGIMGKVVVNGVSQDQIHMPALNENLTVRDRWDLVNFIRSLQAAAKLATPTPNP
jgi:mono/diheme cytochrome c family protein